MKVYPTNRDRGRGRPKGQKKARRAIAAARRVSPPPVIYVATKPESYYLKDLSRAHLRNKRGYVYLAWRDGDRVRNFYLGKAPRKSPTAADPRAPGPGAADRDVDELAP
jgi:hypothetical protein